MSSGGLSKDEIEKMVKEVELHAQKDQKKKELIELRNTADTTNYNIEKSLNEYRDKIPGEVAIEIETTAVSELRNTLGADDLEAIKAKSFDAANKVVSKIGQHMEKSHERGRERDREREKSCERSHDRTRDREPSDERLHKDSERTRDKDRDKDGRREHDQPRDRDHGRDSDCGKDKDRSRDRGRERPQDRDRDTNRDRGRSRDKDTDYDHVESNMEEIDAVSVTGTMNTTFHQLIMLYGCLRNFSDFLLLTEFRAIVMCFYVVQEWIERVARYLELASVVPRVYWDFTLTSKYL
ncbi:hypothetical protein IFM89_019185 [Coptis chinensis]|uniref:Uncharacterized protein n=1 Tax=Coptis chinensis TaxID=261450 RepID=A0A835LC80_9MAGN|nr:hypothetical protein IFM89_019185 [Coptis chinensis]